MHLFAFFLVRFEEVYVDFRVFAVLFISSVQLVWLKGRDLVDNLLILASRCSLSAFK